MSSAIDDYEQGKDDAFNGRPNQRFSKLYDLGFADGLAQLYLYTEEENNALEEEEMNTNQKE